MSEIKGFFLKITLRQHEQVLLQEDSINLSLLTSSNSSINDRAVHDMIRKKDETSNCNGENCSKSA